MSSLVPMNRKVRFVIPQHGLSPCFYWWNEIALVANTTFHIWRRKVLATRRAQPLQGRRGKVMLSITAAGSPALWGRTELSHIGVSFASFRSFPAQLNSPHKALPVIVSKFHNCHNNSETFSTIFPLKELMHISKILTSRSRQEKWNPAKCSLGHYRNLTLSHYKRLLPRAHTWNWKAVPSSHRQRPRNRAVLNVSPTAERSCSTNGIQVPRDNFRALPETLPFLSSKKVWQLQQMHRKFPF